MTSQAILQQDLNGINCTRLLNFYNNCDRLMISDTVTGYMTLDRILAKDDEFWESCHDFIQWVFPTNQPSVFNPIAPILDRHTARWISKRNLLRAFDRFLTFLGVKDPQNPDAIGNIRYARVRQWYQPGNHNLLRITRVLKCLMLCGMYHEARALEYFLHKCRNYAHGNGWESIPQETWDFWNKALMAKGMFQSDFDV